jgi:hypothetical protein
LPWLTVIRRNSTEVLGLEDAIASIEQGRVKTERPKRASCERRRRLQRSEG